MKKLVAFFNYCFAIIPIGFAFFLSFRYACGGHGDIFAQYDPEHFLLPVLSRKLMLAFIAIEAVSLIALNAALIRRDEKGRQYRTTHNHQAANGALIFGLAFAVRMLFIQRAGRDIMPFSDFERVWEIAQGNLSGNADYYTLFPAYFNYAAFEKGLISFAGSNYVNIVYVCAILAGLTAAGVFLIAHRMGSSMRIAVLAGIMCALVPSNIFYTITGSPDFMSVAFNTYGLLMLLIVIDSKDNWVKQLIVGGCAGMLLGVGASYKQFAVIILIAFVISYIASLIHKGETGNSRQGQTKDKWRKETLTAALIFAVIITGYKVSGEMILSHTEGVYGLSLDPGTATPHFFLVGLNTQGEGQIHLGNLSRQYTERYLNNGYDQEEAKEYAYVLLKQDWKENRAIIPNLFVKKVVWAWQDDVIPSQYLKSGNCKYTETKIGTFAGIAQASYMLILILALIGTAYYIRGKDINYKCEMIMLVIFGYFCLLLLSEAQSRYKCLIMPYLCILGAYGVSNLCEIIINRRRRHE